MSKTILCPYCFESFKNTEVMVQCENYSTRIVDGKPVEVCQRENNRVFNDFWAETVMSKHVFEPKIGFMDKLLGYKPKGCACDNCGGISTRFVCPHCYNWLPTEMIEKGSEIISVIGGPASGKSNYIVSMIHQLQKNGFRLNLSQILPQPVGRNKSEYTTALFDKAKETIFKEHIPVSKTPVREFSVPWIFRLESHSSKKAIYLVFYDTAGENFENPDDIKRNAKYLSKSKAVIVLLDTLSIPTVQKILSENNIINQDNVTPLEHTVRTILSFINEYPKIAKIPVAFVMSKFDAIINNSGMLKCDVTNFVENNKWKNSHFIKTGKFSMKEIDTASDTIASYMCNPETWNCEEIYRDIVEKWGDNARFFGVSALGAMTNENLQIDVPDNEEIKPFRVMDPMIWALHKIGGFDIPTDDETKKS